MLALQRIQAQSFPFTSGPIPPCATSTFTAQVDNVGYLGSPNTPWTPFLQSITLNITSDHPQTLSITLTSPTGISLLLSAFNGDGGQNYTNTTFDHFGGIPITGGTAPFTGSGWYPQGGSLGQFNGVYADGTWTITVTDTACANGGMGPGGDWTPGWFDGSAAGGAFAFGFAPPPPCQYWIPSDEVHICPGASVDIQGYYDQWQAWFQYTYTLNGVPVADPRAVTEAGTYEVIGYDLWEGCSYWAWFTVLVDPQVDLGPDRVVTRCPENAPTNLAALFDFNGAAQTWRFNDVPIPILSATAVAQQGIYQVIGRTNAGCNDTALVTVVTHPGPMIGADVAVSICAGESIDVTSHFNTSGNTTSWSLDNITIPPPLAAGTAGLYTVNATDANGCTASADLALTVGPSPSLGGDAMASFCTGSNVDLDPLFDTDGFAATWYLNGEVVSSTAASAGTYMLVAGNTANCTDTATVVVTELPVPELGPDQERVICNGTVIDVAGFFNTTSTVTDWTLDMSPIAPPVAVSMAGTYMVHTTNAHGCEDSATLRLTVQASPALGPDAMASFCLGSDVDLAPLFNVEGFDTRWSMNGSEVSSTAAQPGTYMLVAGGTSSCADTALVIVTALPLPDLGPDRTWTICTGTSTDLTALVPPVNSPLSWTHGGVPFATPAQASAAGAYEVTTQTSTGCRDTMMILVSEADQPALGEDVTVQACSNTAVDLNAFVHTSSFPIAWTYIGAPVANPSAVQTGGIHRAVASNGTSCSDTMFVTVEMHASPVLGPDGWATVCANEVEDITGYFNTSGHTPTWSFSGNVVPDPTAVSEEGTYILVASNPAGCRDTAQVHLAVELAPYLGPDQNHTVCPGLSVDLTSRFTTAGYIARWTLADEPVSSPTAVFEAATYTLVATNTAGCSDTALFVLDHFDAPELGMDRSVDVCMDITTDLTSIYTTTGLVAAWSVNGMSVAEPTMAGSGHYRLIAMNPAGCSDTAYVNIRTHDTPELGEDREFALCAGRTIPLSALVPGGYTTSYSLSGTAVNQPDSVGAAGTYTISATNTWGCADTIVVELTVIECPCVADIIYYGDCLEDPTLFTIEADSTIIDAHWTFGSAAPPSHLLAPSVLFAVNEDITVTLDLHLSCGHVSVERIINLRDCSDSCSVWIPSAFTPNGDTFNDVWSWTGECTPEEFSLSVFDRLGEMIFTTNDPSKAWDGTYAGSHSPAGVYAFRIGYRLPYQKPQQASGHITLLR